MNVRKASDRGQFDHGWLKSAHSFSFGEYQDPRHQGWGPLVVINEDWIQPAEGFPTHGHRDMEILTYVLDGAVAHKDSTGGSGVIHPGEIQMMTAGRGIRHSEFNALDSQTTHLLQIWITPESRSLPPNYRDHDFKPKLLTGAPVLLASPDESEGSLKIHQNAKVWARRTQGATEQEFAAGSGRKLWLQIARGTLNGQGISLEAGDGLALESGERVVLKCPANAEYLWFDLPA